MAKVRLKAIKRLGRYAPGDEFEEIETDANILCLLKVAVRATEPEARQVPRSAPGKDPEAMERRRAALAKARQALAEKREYNRRDMTARE